MPCVVRLEYTSPTPADVKENLFFIGKGVTYDTGGADLKVGGAMRGMSRDKCGASGVAGFMKVSRFDFFSGLAFKFIFLFLIQTVSMLKPTRVNIVAECGFVRNSIGPDAYVSDEIITSRAGVRCLIGNTDAEGRMVMGDILCKLKEEALVKAKTASSIPNRLFTVATLTGHSIRACGHYSVLLENGPAKMDGVAKRIYDAGELFGEPCEITSLRKDDFKVR